MTAWLEVHLAEAGVSSQDRHRVLFSPLGANMFFTLSAPLSRALARHKTEERAGDKKGDEAELGPTSLVWRAIMFGV